MLITTLIHDGGVNEHGFFSTPSSGLKEGRTCGS